MKNRLANIILPLTVFLCLSGFTTTVWLHDRVREKDMMRRNTEIAAERTAGVSAHVGTKHPGSPMFLFLGVALSDGFFFLLYSLMRRMQMYQTARDQALYETNKHKRTWKSPRETRDYLDKLIQYANVPIIVWDPAFKITRFNGAFEYLTNYSVDEVMGKELSILFPETSRDESLQKIGRTSSGEHWESVEIPILRKDGKIRLALWNSANIYAEDGTTLIATIAQGVDITERKAYEKQLKHLSENMIQLQEEERSRISRELHDELGQVLTALKLETAWLKDHLTHSDVAVKNRFQEMCDLLDGLLGTVRRISTDLRPGILDDMGLGPAIEWHASEFERRSGIECLALLDLPDKRLAGHLETGIYRIVQEALTNVARHAKASTITIRINQKGETLFVQIADNGIGIEPSKIRSPLSTGISGMRERAEILSGTVEIKGDSGKGTWINVRIPVMYR